MEVVIKANGNTKEQVLRMLREGIEAIESGIASKKGLHTSNCGDLLVTVDSDLQ